MADERGGKRQGTGDVYSLGICSNHPNTMERIAILEKGMETAESGINKAVEKLDEVRDVTMSEFRIIRDTITEGILKRHSSISVLLYSLLTGLCCALATAFLTQ